MQVYQEYIHDRNHTHMNSTQWETLTEFVKWLGKEGHCVVDETEKGWFIQYIDRDPEAIRRQEAINKKERMDLDDEERRSRFIQQQIERTAAALKHSDETDDARPSELKRDDDEDKVVFKLPVGAPSVKKNVGLKPLAKSTALQEADKAKDVTSHSKQTSSSAKRKSALEEIKEMEEMKKAKKNEKVC